MPRHAEQRQLPYRAQDMYDLVADVGRYPEFLPWCRAARIRQQTDTLLIADLVIGFKGITESFTSKVTLDRENLTILTEYQDGPFKYMENHWKFDPVETGNGCELDFYVDFEFRSRLLQTMIGLVFGEAVKRMVSSFETRAAEIYGKQS